MTLTDDQIEILRVAADGPVDEFVMAEQWAADAAYWLNAIEALETVGLLKRQPNRFAEDQPEIDGLKQVEWVRTDEADAYV